MKSFIGVCLLLAVPAAFAQGPTSASAGGYLFHERAEVDGPGGGGSDSSMGIGLKGQLNFTEQIFGHVEFQDAKLSSFRLGGGVVLPANPGMDWVLSAALIDKDVDDGLGLFGGLRYQANPQVQLKGTLGYLLLGDFDGLELTLGADYKFDRYWTGFTDLRLFRGNGDGAVDFSTSEFHIGAAYNFTF